MRPTKSRRFCPDCGKMKIVFDSEGAANKFIEYNSEEIKNEGGRGYAPTHAYYCDVCCGWHVTHRIGFKGRTPIRKAIDFAVSIQRDKKSVREKYWDSMRLVCDHLVQAIKYAQDGDAAQALDEWQKVTPIWDELGEVFGLPPSVTVFKQCSENMGNTLRKEMDDPIAMDEVLTQLTKLMRSHRPSLFYTREQLGISKKAKCGQVFDKQYDTKTFLVDVLAKSQPQMISKTKKERKQEAAEEAEAIKVVRQCDIAYDLTMTLEAIHAQIACGDMDDARQDIIKVIEKIPSLTNLAKRAAFAEEVQKTVAEHYS